MKELLEKFKELKKKILETKKLLDLETKKLEIKKLETSVNKPGFWDNQEKARKVSRELSEFVEEVDVWETLERDVEDGLGLLEMAKKQETRNEKQGKSDSLGQDLESEYNDLSKRYNELEFYVLFSGKYDKNNAILAIHAGAGGDDAQDWAEMLLRMFLRYCESKGFKANIIDKSAGGEAGIKSAVVEVIGKHVYGFLKSEAGVHRLVRISPFDAEKMRHTSFAMVEVLPELDDVKMEIKDEDLRIDTFCASGHGGQGVNTTYSAVRIVHLPTKITVNCQNERSQMQNKETALKILKSKVFQYYQTEKEEEKQQLRGEFKEAAWGNQIRSYVLHPYKMVKDHRTKFETQDVGSVLDGDIGAFVDAYLKNEMRR